MSRGAAAGTTIATTPTAAAAAAVAAATATASRSHMHGEEALQEREPIVQRSHLVVQAFVVVDELRYLLLVLGRNHFAAHA
jgi:hypothetical protein